MNELIDKLKQIDHPNVSIEMFPPNKRLSDIERADIISPLTPALFVLFRMVITNGVSIFTETTNYLFIYKHLFIKSSLGLEYSDRSDGSIDAKGSSCKLLLEKTGVKSFELFFDTSKATYYLDLNLNDGNKFRSVGFKSEKDIPESFIPTLNQALEINKWD